MMQYPTKQNSMLDILILLIVFAVGFKSEAQEINIKSDLQLLEKKLSGQQIQKRKNSFIYKGQTFSFRTHNPVSLLYGGMLFVYQNSLSHHFSADCLYHPSCSAFSKQAVSECGLVKGGLLTVERLNRCNRISAVDLHHAPVHSVTKRVIDPVSKYK
jgi:putative component of membrane protein insertase Oxa1/YidC/SpoIIIJ protein YidD